MLRYDVVIPAFNAAANISAALDGITRQAVLPAKIIVVDDGSTDDTASIAQAYGPLVSLVHTENAGIGLSKKIGIEHCTSPLVALCGSNDIWGPDHIARRVELLAEFPEATVTYSDFYSVGPQGTHALRSSVAPRGWHGDWELEGVGDYFQLRDPYLAVIAFNPIYQSSMLFSRQAYIQMGGFLPRYSRWIGENTEFVHRFMRVPGIVVAGDAKATWEHRTQEHWQAKSWWRHIICKARILQAHRDLGLVHERYLATLNHELTRTVRHALDHAYGVGNFKAVVDITQQFPHELHTLSYSYKLMRAKFAVTKGPA